MASKPYSRVSRCPLVVIAVMVCPRAAHMAAAESLVALGVPAAARAALAVGVQVWCAGRAHHTCTMVNYAFAESSALSCSRTLDFSEAEALFAAISFVVTPF